jgi:hypothetical protein
MPPAQAIKRLRAESGTHCSGVKNGIQIILFKKREKNTERLVLSLHFRNLR